MVVVGGGPAGACAAYHLARRGHSVLVCEKKVFPREKACGDGLTPRALTELSEMGLGGEAARWQRVEGLRVHAHGRSTSIPFPPARGRPGFGVVRSRAALDHAVLSNAEQAGAKVLYGAEAMAPIFRGGTVSGAVVRHEGEPTEVNAPWLVCAEGAATKFGRSLGRARIATYPVGFAVRQYFPAGGEPSDWFDAYLTVRSGRHLIPGYGWSFPVSATEINAGVGFLYGAPASRREDVHRLQREFVGTIGPGLGAEGRGSRPRGGRLFSGASVWPPCGPGFVLVGDAAGMVNPFTGEGIAYAYETGRIAATHIGHALDTGRSPSLPGYTEELLDTYGPYYRLGRSFARLMARPGVLERVTSAAMRSDELMRLIGAVLLNLDDESSRVQRTGIRILQRIGRSGGGGR